MSKMEEKNVKNYLSIVNELYLQKMQETDKQISEILQQLEDVNNKLEKIQEQKNIYKYENSSDTSRPHKKVTKRYKTKDNKYKQALGEIFFWIFLIAMVLFAFCLRSNKSGKPTSIAGYTFFTILTGSMENEIPQGSLIISKNVNAEKLKIGDNITFIANQNTIITHKIIAITENYENTGKRAFETKGTMNEKADQNLVLETNIVGKVVYHNKLLGKTLNYIAENWIFLIFVIIVIGIFIRTLKNLSNETD